MRGADEMKVRTAYGFPVIVEYDSKTGKANKRPLIREWQKSTTPVDELHAKNFGINVPQDVIVIDIDTHKGCSKQLIEQAIGDTLDDAGFLQTTISGGQHYGYEVPPNMTFKQGSNLLGITGFDTRCHGRGWVASGEGYHGDIKTRIQSKLPILPVAFVTALVEQGRLEIVERPTNANVNQEALRDALRHVDPHDYDDWVKVGMALYGVPGGFSAWDQWSATADNYDPAVMDRKWESFADTSVSVGSVFYMAQQQGWEHHGSVEGYDPDDFSQEAPEANETLIQPLAIDFDGIVRMPDFCLEGLVQEGAVVFVGESSAGKTTTLIPMALATAGLLPRYPFQPLKPMTVLYFTEDILQAERTVRALHADGQLREYAPEKVAFVQAQHHSVRWYIKAAQAYDVVVFDTVSNCFEVKDENSNAEIASLLAKLRTGIGKCLWFVTHTAKANRGSERVDTRGAGAWRDNVQQTINLTIVDDQRFVELDKRRFDLQDYGTSKLHKVITQEYAQQGVNKLGELRDITLRYNFIAPYSSLEREEDKEERKLQQMRATEARIEDDLMVAIRDNPNTPKTELLAMVQGRKDKKRDVLANLLRWGNVQQVKEGKCVYLKILKDNDVPF